MSDITWEEPPKATPRQEGRRWPDFLKELKKNRGVWAKFGAFANTDSARASGRQAKKNHAKLCRGMVFAARESVLYVKYDPKEAKETTR